MSSITFTFCILFGCLFSIRADDPVCNQETLDKSFVTQCGLSVCEPVLDKVPADQKVSEWPSTGDTVVHITSTRAGERLKVRSYKSLDRISDYYEESHVNGTMFVDTNVKYQRVLGFGTTLTDASCRNIDDLPEEIRKKLISDYFSTESGIGLNLIKIPIGSTKYSFSNYVLDQPDESQVELSAYDTDHRVPLIYEALEQAGRWKSRIKVLASSASAPPVYKKNNKLINGGNLRPDRIKDYATYLLGFIEAYKAHNINIWSIITSELPVTIAQQKDVNDTTDYNSMVMKPSEAIALIRSINELRSSRQASDDKFRLLLLGDQRAHIPVWADAVFKNSDVANSVAGVAYSCEGPEFAPYDNLVYVTRRYPSKYLMATQSTINSPPRLGDWQYGQNFATEIIKNLEWGSVSWIDANLALDLKGGPTIKDAFKADASVIVDPRRGAYYRNPMFYAIGHLSRYVKPGSIRVKSNFYFGAHMFANQYTAFVTPDNYLVVVVLNNNIEPMSLRIGINTRTKVELLLETKSFNTFIFRL